MPFLLLTRQPAVKPHTNGSPHTNFTIFFKLYSRKNHIPRYFGDDCGTCLPSYWATPAGLCVRQYIIGKTLYDLQVAPAAVNGQSMANTGATAFGSLSKQQVSAEWFR